MMIVRHLCESMCCSSLEVCSFLMYGTIMNLMGLLVINRRRFVISLLLLSFSLFNENTLLCVITDNGIGRKKAKEIKARKQLSHQSMGMTVTQDRIDILNEQNNNLLTKVVVIDHVLNDIAVGTTVEITINIKNSQND